MTGLPHATAKDRLRASGLSDIEVEAAMRAARDEHAAKHDDGRTCGDVDEHKDLFNTVPRGRSA